MSKYAFAKAGIQHAVDEARNGGVDKDDVLLALIVSAVDEYAKSAGREEAAKALTYELDQLGGGVDTVFLRSR